MAKIVFVNPPTMDYAYAELRKFALAVPPLGMAYIAAYLDTKGIDVDIVDCDALKLDIAGAVDLVIKKNPDYVGLMAMTATMDIAAGMFRQLRSRMPGTVLILGGVHGTALPERTLQEVPEIDYIVMGEGEYTTEELINNTFQGASFDQLRSIQGISFRHENKIYVNERRKLIEDIDSLPFPARHLLPLNEYNGPGWFRWLKGYVKPFFSVFSSRGCPFSCNFCASHLMCGRRVRYRSVENVMAEVDLLKETYDIKVLHFQDDTFTLKRDRAIEICKALASRDYKLRIMCSTRVDQVDEELLRYMKTAGVEWIFYGVESGNDEILKKCSKNTSTKQIEHAYKITKQAGISTHAGMILGHTGETYKTAMDSIRFLKKLNPDYAGIATLIPFPGSYAWDYCLENDVPLPENWSDYGMVNSIPIAVNKDLTSADLLKLRDKAIFSYYSSPKRIFRMLTDSNYNRTKLVMDHLYNAYALLLRKLRQKKQIACKS